MVNIIMMFLQKKKIIIIKNKIKMDNRYSKHKVLDLIVERKNIDDLS